MSSATNFTHPAKRYCLLCWGLTTRQPLWVILCRLPEKGRKRDRRDSRRAEREGQRRKRNTNESEETEEMKTFSLYLYLLHVQG